MRKRSLVEKFSTFLEAEESFNRLIGTIWRSDPRLQRNIQRVIETEEDEEKALAELILQRVLLTNDEERLYPAHLSAYLEKVCYWVATEVCRELAFLHLSPLDCLSRARAAAAFPQQTFKNYKFGFRSVSSYGEKRIKTTIKDAIATAYQLSQASFRYGDWGLLRNISRRKFQQALKSIYRDKAVIQRHLLAVECYKAVYVPTEPGGNQPLPEPNETQWQAIVREFNELSLLRHCQPTDRQEIQELLEVCIEAARNHGRPTVSYCDPNDPNSPLGREPSEGLEEVSIGDLTTIARLFQEAFSSLSLEKQRMLKLRYGLSLTQTELAPLFNFQEQYQVSRQLKRDKMLLWNAFAPALVQTYQGTASTAREFDREIKPIFEDCLQKFCRGHYEQFLQQVLLQKLQNEVSLLRLYYGAGLDLMTIAEELHLGSEEAVRVCLQQVEEALQTRFLECLQDQLHHLALPRQRIERFVHSWLEQAPYATFESGGHQ